MNINKRLKNILTIYLAGLILVTFATLAFLYFKSYWVFFVLTVLVFVVSYLMPLWFRLFLKARIYNGKYKSRLIEFSKKQNVHLRDIYLMESKRSNACAFSFGDNKTVCFNSNTLDNHPWDEIEGVMAHEIGHHANGDIYVYSTIIAVILIVSSWINVTVYSFLPPNFYYLIAICIVTATILLPIVLRISRWREQMADNYAKTILNEPAKLARFLERMLTYEEKAGDKISNNLTFYDKIFLTHPWVFNRIRSLKSY